MKNVENTLLSIVLPSYNEEENICRAAMKLKELFEKQQIKYELIFVNDGSKDDTWNQICKVKKEDVHVVGICFSRNFGKEAAIRAGLEYCTGSAAVVMDCDLQHPPETIIRMYELWKQGYEVVEGVKRDRGKESRVHRFAANSFYGILSRATHIDMRNASDFKLLDRKAIDAILSMEECNGFFRAMSSWVGFRIVVVEFEVQERTFGESKWSLWALIRYAINNITAFTMAPLLLIAFVGFVSLVAGIMVGVSILVVLIRGAIPTELLVTSFLQLILDGSIMIGLGIIGYYLARIYDETRKRPHYIVSKKI